MNLNPETKMMRLTKMKMMARNRVTSNFTISRNDRGSLVTLKMESLDNALVCPTENTDLETKWRTFTNTTTDVFL